MLIFVMKSVKPHKQTKSSKYSNKSFLFSTTKCSRKKVRRIWVTNKKKKRMKMLQFLKWTSKLLLRMVSNTEKENERFKIHTYEKQSNGDFLYWPKCPKLSPISYCSIPIYNERTVSHKNIFSQMFSSEHLHYMKAWWFLIKFCLQQSFRRKFWDQ